MSAFSIMHKVILVLLMFMYGAASVISFFLILMLAGEFLSGDAGWREVVALVICLIPVGLFAMSVKITRYYFNYNLHNKKIFRLVAGFHVIHVCFSFSIIFLEISRSGQAFAVFSDAQRVLGALMILCFSAISLFFLRGSLRDQNG